MRVYLAGTNALRSYDENLLRQKLCVLESFAYIDEKTINFLPYWDFILDSGAYTFMNNVSKTEIDWDDYVDRYADFIKAYNIKLFFELDIDSIIGIKEVERLRNRLESKTGKRSIPVWHNTRGVEYFRWMCKEYPYVAIGGLVAVARSKKAAGIRFMKLRSNWFIGEAHKNGAKLHVLGFTPLDITKYSYDSVDSTSWLGGGRFGILFKFNGRKLVTIPNKSQYRLNTAKANIHNFNEWVKFQRFMILNEKKVSEILESTLESEGG